MIQKNNLPTIALCLITFNESKVLLRCLNSLLPIIDYYLIVDTGSSDNSKQIIKDFFDSNGIEGEIHDAPNFDMSENLNFAFSKLKDKVDFAFYIDSDNELVVPEKFNIETFKKQLILFDGGIIKTIGDNQENGKTLLYNLNKNWTWNGVIHEVATCDGGMPPMDTGLNIIIHNDGNSWTSQTLKEKYLKHVKMLLKDIEKNGLNPRTVFYIAQSYRDADEPHKAIEWYERRTELKNGFYEELYYSRLMIAGLKWQLNYPVMEVADEYMRCGELDTLRAEHLFNLKQMYERNNRPQCAIKIGELLIKYKNPYPNRILFINPLAYD